MPLLTTIEALEATDAFLWTLYGEELFDTWKTTKIQMNFRSEREYVTWLMQIASEYGQNISDHPDHIASSPRKRRNHQMRRTVVETQEEKLYVLDVKQELSIVAGEDNTEAVNAGEDSIETVNAGEVTYEVNDKYYSDGNVRGYERIELSTSSSAQQNVTDTAASSSTRGKYDDGDRQLRAEEITLDSDNDSEMAMEAIDTGTYMDSSIPDKVVQYDPDAGNGSVEDRLGYNAGAGPSTATANNLAAAAVAVAVAGRTRSSRQFACPHCLYTCHGYRHNLASHLIYRHGYPSRFTCTRCGKGMHSSARLRSHVDKCHRDITTTTRPS